MKNSKKMLEMQLPDVLLIVHLDDSFVKNKIDIYSKYVEKKIDVTDLVLKPYILMDDTKDASLQEILKELCNLRDVIIKIKKRAADCLFSNREFKIFLLNYQCNSTNIKRIYEPLDKYIYEILNCGELLERNKIQSVDLLKEMANLGLFYKGKIFVEICGVYRFACVNAVNNHLTTLISEQNLNIEKWLNEDLSI
jgi:hypothetical protein